MSGILEINKSNFQSEVLESSTPVLIDFWAEWCGPCRSQGPVLEAVAPKIAPIKIGKINIDKEPELQEKYGIQAVPTMLIFKDGAEQIRFSGFHPEPALLERLKPYIK